MTAQHRRLSALGAQPCAEAQLVQPPGVGMQPGIGGVHGGGQAPELALSQALTATLIAYCIGGFFLSQAFSAFLYSILGMVVGLAKITPRPVRSAFRPT